MKRKNFTIHDIPLYLQRRSWWAILAVLPLANRLSLLLLNYTNIKPNCITILSFVFAVIASILFLGGSHPCLICAAMFFYISYLLDCVDGTVARVRKQETPVGAYIDQLCDRIKFAFLVLALGYGQYRKIGSEMPMILSSIYLASNNLMILSRSIQFKIIFTYNLNEKTGVEMVKNELKSNVISKAISKWLKITYNRNIMPYYHDVETDAIVFFIGPILNEIALTLKIGITLSLILVGALNAMFLASLIFKGRKSSGN